MWHQRKLWLFLAVLANCLVLCPCTSLMAWTPRKPLLYGVADRIDGSSHTYVLARSQAWLRAVNRAVSRLPGDVGERLRQLGLPVREGREAMAALMFPLDVVTPEHVAGTQVRVFLKDDTASRMKDEILADPWRLLLEMCILRETAAAVAAMADDSPSRKSDDGDSASLLRRLWRAACVNSLPARRDEEDRDDLAAPSVAINLMLAARGAPDSLGYADRAIALCMDREVSGSDPALWSVLAAYGSYLRARGHERQGQPALAETDLDTAINRIRESGMAPGLELDAILARADLRRKRGNVAGMCEDYREACGLGRCRQLARARHQGFCGS